MSEGAPSSRRFLLESWLELREALDSHPEIRRLLFDPVTELFSWTDGTYYCYRPTVTLLTNGRVLITGGGETPQ